MFKVQWPAMAPFMGEIISSTRKFLFYSKAKIYLLSKYESDFQKRWFLSPFHSKKYGKFGDRDGKSPKGWLFGNLV